MVLILILISGIYMWSVERDVWCIVVWCVMDVFVPPSGARLIFSISRARSAWLRGCGAW